MMKAAPTSSFIMAEAEFLLELLVVPFDPPAQLGEIDQFGEGNVGFSQMPSIPSHSRWSRRRVMPRRSPIPSLLESANERG